MKKGLIVVTGEREHGGAAGAVSRRKALAATGALTPLLVGAGTAPAAAGHRPVDGRGAEWTGRLMRPVPTTEADWEGVADALGRPGRLMGGTVHRVGFPRRDLRVVSHGITVKPGLALGSWAAFARYPDRRTLVTGDLVVTEEELQQVTDALHANGLDQTAIHKHLPAHTPDIWWTHIHGLSRNPVDLARGIRAALDVTGTPGPARPSEPPRIALDTKGIDAALDAKGTNDGGIYKFSFARLETISDHHRVLPPAMGVTTALNFQPVGEGRAAINGDIVMTADEVQDVLVSLRRGGISVIALHNHALRDEPRLFYTHFWAVDDAVKLARALRPAVEATNVAPAN
jgi:hypothetical protein